MTEDLLERARAVVAAARKRGAQQVRAGIWRSRDGEVAWRDGKLDRLRESTRLSLGVTLFVDGRYSANSTSDLRPAAIERFLDETVAFTRVLAKDVHRKLPDPERYTHRHAGELGIWDEPGIADSSEAQRRRHAQLLEQAVRSAPAADRIVSVTAGATDSTSETAMVCSNGMEGTHRSTGFDLYAGTSVRDQGDRKPEGFWHAFTRQRRKLPSIESIGKEALRRALQDRGAKPRNSGKYACVIENVVAGRLLQDLLTPLGGRAIQQKRSFLADKLRKQVASQVLTVTDDPWLVEGNATAAYDGEGMSTLRRPLIERGVLRTFFLDTYYASKLGQRPTTAAPSNLVFACGKRGLAGLLATMQSGILVTDFIGGNANSATGDFSVGIRGQWVERGVPVAPVAEMNLAGNALEFWRRLGELGNDPYPYSSVRSPSLLFEAVQFSGT
jgi:PmbA protein